MKVGNPEVGTLENWRTEPGFIAFRVVEIAGDRYISVEEYTTDAEAWAAAYEHHRRSKNYFARLVGLHAKFKFNREFLKFKQFDGELFVKADFEPGELFEVCFIYYSGSGRPNPNLNAVLEFVGFDGDLAVFRRVSEAYALNRLSELDKPEVVRLEVPAEVLEELAALIKRAREEKERAVMRDYAAGFEAGAEEVLKKLGLYERVLKKVGELEG